MGDDVYGMNDWFGDGAQAEYCLARVTDIARKPRSVDHTQAAITPISALTAWQGLFDRARIARANTSSFTERPAASGVSPFSSHIYAAFASVRRFRQRTSILHESSELTT